MRERDPHAPGEVAAGVQTPSDARSTRTHADPLQQLAPGALISGRYRIREFIGIGGMGIVYRAHDQQLDLEVALKVLRPEFGIEEGRLDRFRRELILARQVTHRNVVRIHDLGADGELYFLTMDLVRGRSLSEQLAREGRFPAERAVPIVRQLAAGLEAAHEEGVVHRDLKPSNILLDDSGRAYITDFGVARSLTAAGLTQKGAVVGTPDYLSPEQARGEEVDGRSDLYALGIVLFELLSGELPFRGESYSEILAQRLTGRPKELTQLGVALSPQLRAIVRRCLEREPARRYQHARELIADLDALGVRPRRRRSVIVATAGALVLLALSWLGWRAGQGSLIPGPWTHWVSKVQLPAARSASLLVLPFVNETGRSDLAWTGSGLAELLAEVLAESPAVRVIDSFRLRTVLDDLKLGSGPYSESILHQLAELFEADHLVTARLRAQGGKLRVEARLLSSGRPEGLASAALPPVVAGAGEIQRLGSELGRVIRSRLEVGGPAEAAGFSSAPAALEAYANGVELLGRGDALAAAPLLKRAVETDSAFTAAWIRLAAAQQALGYDQQALEASARAVSTLGRRKDRIAFEALAQRALLQGEPQRAQQILRDLMARYPNHSEAGLQLAEAYEQSGDLGAAIEVLQHQVEIDPANPRGWYLLAKNSILSGNGRQAVDEYLVRALVLQNKLRSRQGKADVLNAFGVAYRELGELEQAGEHYRQAAQLRREIGDLRGYATTLRNLSGIDLVRGDFNSAQDNLEQALAILVQIGDQAGIADVHNDSGVLEEERGRYAAALEHYRRGLQLRRQLGDQRAIAESQSNVGYAYYLQAQYDNAMVYWQQSLDLVRQSGNLRGVVLGTQNIGLLQLAQGDWDAAAKSFLTALEQGRKVEHENAVAVSLGHLGRLAQWQGRFPAALASYAEALEILERLGDQRGQVEFGLGAAETLLDLGLWTQVQERLESVGAMLESGGNHEQRAELLRLRGELHRKRHESAAALRAFQSALEEARAGHALVALLFARLGSVAASLNQNGDAQAAVTELAKLESEADPIGHALLELRILETLALAELRRGQLERAEQAVSRALRRAGRCGSYAGAHRLHWLHSQILQARGSEAAATSARGRAAAELLRIRTALDPTQRQGFDQLVEVREIDHGTTQREDSGSRTAT